jgi:HK97 family phage major capsid protein
MIRNPLRAFLALLAWHGVFHAAPRQVIGFRKARRYEHPGLYPIFAIAGADERGDTILESIRGKSVDDLKDNTLPDELRGKTPDELTTFVEVLDAHLRSLHQDEDSGELRDKSEDEQKAFDYGLKLRDKAIKRVEEHRAIQEVFRRRPKSVEAAMFKASSGSDDPYADTRRLSNAEARDKALRALDDRNSSARLTADQQEQVEKQIRRNTDIARRVIVTENEHYREAWMKLVTHPQGAMFLNEDERQAIRAWEEYRAASEGTTTAGGFGIPVFIDPSIILTAQGSGNPFLTLARQVEVNTNKWKGVSSAGVSWAFQAEAATVADNAPTIAQPEVDVYMARGFIPFSIEVGQDYPGFADEMQTLLASGYDELLIDKFTRGSGSNEPTGLITALSANTNVRVTVASGGSLTQSDPYKVWKALPQRFRRNASWLMNVGVNNSVRQLGTANVFHAYTENLPAEWADMLFGKAVYESPYMNDVTTSTSATIEVAAVGDFSNYVIARRGGMSVELVPHLVDATISGTARPTGQRGWFAYARIGGNSVNDLGFRLLTNT